VEQIFGNQQKNTKNKFQIGDYVLWFPKGENTHLGKFLKKWFRPFKVQYCLPNNNNIIIYVNNFEPNLVLVNFNKLKPYKYVNQTLKGIQNSKYQMSLKSIDLNHKEEKSNEHSKDHRTIKIIDTDHTIASEEASINLMS
jgi:hypothetical protein